MDYKVTGYDLRVTLEQALLLHALFTSEEYESWHMRNVGKFNSFSASQASGLKRKIIQTGLAAADTTE